MNNLHRELAPISDAAWAQIEEEAARTFKRYLAGRRVVDVEGPGGRGLSAVGTGHLSDDRRRPARASLARQRRWSSPWSSCACRSSWTASRSTTWSAARTTRTGSRSKDAARQIAFAEDRAIFEGYTAGGIDGIRQGSSNPPLDAAGRRSGTIRTRSRSALEQLRLAGVDGPYSVVLGADAYTAVERDQRSRLPGASSTSSGMRERRHHLGAGASPAGSC